MRKALLGLIVVSLGMAWGQAGAAPLVGALLDLYANYQQNRPRLAGTPEQESLRAERARAAAIGAVAGALTTLLVDHVQTRNQMRRSHDGFEGGESEQAATQEPVPVPR